jgi:sirohydrochlorin ferrochelatase
LVARAITIQAARRLGCVPATAAYVELARPLIVDEMAANAAPAIVVPLLLSTGYHVRHDLPRAMRQSPVPVRMARPLGPHPLLADAMCWRLRAAGAQLGDPVVMVAAGSNDPASEADLAEAGRLLAGRWGGPVRVATVGGQGTPAVDAIREFGTARVAVAPYLLAPGHFAKRVQVIARSAGVGTVAEVLGVHPLVVEVVCRRYRAVLAAASRSAAA